MKSIRSSVTLSIIIPYLLLSLIWIVITDSIIRAYWSVSMGWVEVWKDGAFVLLTVLVLWVVIQRAFHQRERIEAELLRQTTFLENTIEAAIDGVLIVGKDRQIQVYNQRFLEMSNIPPEVAQTRSSKLFMQAVLGQLADPGEFVAKIEYLYEHPQERSRDEIATNDGRILDRYSAPILSARGEYYGRVWFYRDISDLKQVQQRLGEREAMFRSLVMSMNDIVFTLDCEQRHTGVYGHWTERYGLDPDFFLGKTATDLFDESMANIHIAANEAALTGEFVLYEWSSETPQPMAVQTSLSPIHDEHGNITGVVGVGRDITQLKATEQELRRLNRALKTVSACHQALVHATDEQQVLARLCESMVEVGGYRMAWIGFADAALEYIEPVAWAGHEAGYLDLISEYMPEEGLDMLPGLIALRQGHPRVIDDIANAAEFGPWRSDAIARGYASCMALPLVADPQTYGPDGLSGVLGVYANEMHAFDEEEIHLLTDLSHDLVYAIMAMCIRAEHRRTEAFLQNILEIAANAMIATDGKQRVLWFNPAAELIFGYRESEVVNQPFDMLLMPSSVAQYHDYVQYVQQLTVAQRSGAYCEVEALRRDGSPFPSEVSLAPSHLNGHTTFTVIVRDISAQKRAEDELIASRDTVSTILESITDAFFALDATWRFVYVNREAESIFQRPREALLEQNIWDMLPDVVGSVFEQEYHRAIANQEPITFEGWYAPLATWFESRVYPSSDGLSVYFRDISERKRAEQELHRLNYALRMLSECNKALVRASDEAELLQNICDIIVDVGGYRMAWVGFDDDTEEQRIVPVSQAGVVGDYLDDVHITWKDNERGQGPTGRAVRTGQPCVTQNMQHDPSYAPWRERALAYGFAASVALPLLSDAPSESTLLVRGALNIYAHEPDVFDAAKIGLLTELADDLVYGIVSLRTRVERQRLLDEVQVANERLHMLSRRLVEVQEIERRHIARELHDEIGQALTGLHLALEMANRVQCAGMGNRLVEAHSLVNELMSRVREMSLNLRPAMLDDLGVLPTLRWLFQRYMAQTSIRVVFKHTSMERRFESEIETVVYRVIQEALTNVARYAGVSQVTVRLWSDAHSIGVQVEDEGTGFDVDTVLESNASSGLAGMRERVSLLNGDFSVESAPGAGTCLSVELPLVGGEVALSIT